MKAILSLLALAISATAFAQLELTPPVVGPFSIKGHKLWTFGPLADNEVFTIPNNDPFGRSYVWTGAIATGSAEIQYDFGGGGNWRSIVTLAPGSPYLIYPRPGLLLPPGNYRIFNSSNGRTFVSGYLSPATTFPPYSGMDEYPPVDRLWAIHSYGLYGNLEWDVPTNKAYVITGYTNIKIDRLVSGQWQQYLLSDNARALPLPGLRLPAGHYRVDPNDIRPQWCSGFVSPES